MRPKSKKPSKQRLYEYKTSKHENHKLLSAPLSKELQNERGIRSLPIREGDSVVIVRGEYTGKKGKVSRTDPQKHRIYVDGIGGRKTDAQEIAIPIHPSNVFIQKINMKDKDARQKVILRKIEDEDKKEEVALILEEEAAADAEEAEDLIEFDDDELLDEDDELLLDDDELLDEEFDLTEEDDEDLDEDLDEEDDDEEDEEDKE